MADPTFLVNVVTPERTVYSNPVTQLNVMAWDGYLGVLANHAPMLEQLGIGELRMTEPNGREIVFAISGGFMEVGPQRTIVLADSAERPTEIDVARAEASRQRAQDRISGRLETADFDNARAQAALSRAVNRLKIAASPAGASR
jgi:F-type H+-transporting ATPase subunit epsilon